MDTHGSIREVCRLFGKSRQAFYQLEKRRIRGHIGDEILLMYVRAIRVRQPRMGTRKLSRSRPGASRGPSDQQNAQTGTEGH